MRLRLAPAIAVLVLLGCDGRGPDGDARRVAKTLASAAARMEGFFPNTVLTTHENRAVRFYEDLVKGKVVLINFMFTDCRAICPVTTAKLVKVQKALGNRVARDVFLYSITLDPEHDTPEVLRRYAERLGAGPGWPFLTGRKEDVEALRRRLGFYDPDPTVDADMMQHAGLVLYGNEPKGRWATVTALAEPAAIVRAVRRVMGPGRG